MRVSACARPASSSQYKFQGYVCMVFASGGILTRGLIVYIYTYPVQRRLQAAHAGWKAVRQRGQSGSKGVRGEAHDIHKTEIAKCIIFTFTMYDFLVHCFQAPCSTRGYTASSTA